MNEHNIKDGDSSENKDIFNNSRYASRDRLFANSTKIGNFQRDLGKIIQEEGLGQGNSMAKAKWLVADMNKEFGGLTKKGPGGGVNENEMREYFRKLKTRNDGLSRGYVEKLENIFLRNHKNN